ncbi:hypothetical protein ACERII_12560 [Evansella sp. AB-rgal1]|uniref:zinc ribbon domain-containing protein n=1 Tax=Evansella sp. AB-rgal1 TaxID=3242696 RepID=UPI00359EB532
MYCKHCGTKNPENATYCIKDGVSLTKNENLSVQVTKGSTKFCRKCSHQNGNDAAYCMSCGNSLENIEEITNSTSIGSLGGSLKLKQPKVSVGVGGGNFSGLKSIIDKNNLKSSAIYSSISIAIILIISLIASTLINKRIANALFADFGDIGNSFNLKLVSTTDLLMLSHLAGVNYEAMVPGFVNLQLNSAGGLFLFLLIPAIVLTITGFIIHYNSEKSIGDRLYQALSVAVVYAVIMGIISLFAGVSTNFSIPGESVSADIAANYSFFQVLFSSFIISSLFVFIGSIIRLPKVQKEQVNSNYSNSIYRAVLTTVLGVFIMFVIGYVSISTEEELEMDPLSKQVVASQFGGYYWNLAHLGSLRADLGGFPFNGIDIEFTAKYSIIGGTSASYKDGEWLQLIYETEGYGYSEQEFHEMFAEAFEYEVEQGLQEAVGEIFGGFMWLLVIVPVVLHAWAGKQLTKVSNGNILFELGAYAVAFGVINAVIVSITRFSVDLDLGMSFGMFGGWDLFQTVFTFGFSTILTFLLSTILAFAISYLGVMLLGSASSNQLNREREAA